MSRRNQQPRLRIPKPTDTHDLAKKRGVIPVRRPVSPKSYDQLDSVMEYLETIGGSALRLFSLESTGVTIIPYTRFTQKHRIKSPSIHKVASQQVPSSLKETSATVKHFFLAGHDSIAKIAIELDAPAVVKEKDRFERYYDDNTMPLREISPRKPFKAHCSLATVHREDYADIKELLAATDLAGIVGRNELILEPIETKYHD